MQCDIMWIIALSIVQLQSVWEQTNQQEGKHEENNQVEVWQARVVQVLEDAEVQEDHRDGQGTRNNNQRLTYMLTGSGMGRSWMGL